MSNLFYRSGGITRAYPLQTSVDTSHKLCVRASNTTFYLPLASGAKSGNIHVRVAGVTFHVYSLLSTGMFKGILVSTFAGSLQITINNGNIEIYCGSRRNGAEYDIYVYFPSGVTKCILIGVEEYRYNSGGQIAGTYNISETLSGNASSWVKTGLSAFNDGDTEDSQYNVIRITDIEWRA